MTDALRRQIQERELWYHTIELAPGVATPGWFDLRPIVDRMPWPEVEGRRCLDIGAYDGFLSFELERRGASEVVAVDISDHDAWDWPPHLRAKGGAELARLAGEDKGGGFEIARAALGSRVERRPISIYDLDPDEIGRFDVVVCGSLLLHLRDPLRALEAVRGVTDGVFLSAEAIDLPLTALHPRKPVAKLVGVGDLCQWWVPNAAGHERMLRSAGFDVSATSGLYSIPNGVAHRRKPRRLRARALAGLQRAMTGGVGVPHHAALCRPAV